jgi:two-component system, NarL family, nitrate/nitrite response regulator NarL
MICGEKAVDAFSVVYRPSVYVIGHVRLVREGLSSQLERDGRPDLLGAGRPDATTLARLVAAPPAALVLDLGVPGGVRFAEQLRAALPTTRLIGFAVGDGDGELLSWARTGVCGYIEPEGSAEDIVATVLHALKGELYCSPRFAARLLTQLAARRPEAASAAATAALTPREREILNLIVRGASNKDIARRLGISVATVKNHVHHLLDKLAVRRRSQVSAVVQGLQLA